MTMLKAQKLVFQMCRYWMEGDVWEDKQILLNEEEQVEMISPDNKVYYWFSWKNFVSWKSVAMQKLVSLKNGKIGTHQYR